MSPDTDLVPTRKISAVGVAGAVTAVLVWLATLGGLEVPPEVAGAVTVLVAFAGGYFTRESPDA